jgi:hypothetical protein
VLQPPAYTSAEGWSTFIVLILAGAKDLLRLPSQFVESKEGQEMAYATLQECSVGQPKYRVEVYYDGEGVCYFRDGWSKFFIDYGMHEGWFILFTNRDGKRSFTVCISTVLSLPIPSPPGHEGQYPAALPLSRISSTSSAGFSGTKSMRHSRHAEEGEHLQG